MRLEGLRLKDKMSSMDEDDITTLSNSVQPHYKDAINALVKVLLHVQLFLEAKAMVADTKVDIPTRRRSVIAYSNLDTKMKGTVVLASCAAWQNVVDAAKTESDDVLQQTFQEFANSQEQEQYSQAATDIEKEGKMWSSYFKTGRMPKTVPSQDDTYQMIRATLTMLRTIMRDYGGTCQMGEAALRSVKAKLHTRPPDTHALTPQQRSEMRKQMERMNEAQQIVDYCAFLLDMLTIKIAAALVRDAYDSDNQLQLVDAMQNLRTLASSTSNLCGEWIDIQTWFETGSNTMAELVAKCRAVAGRISAADLRLYQKHVAKVHDDFKQIATHPPSQSMHPPAQYYIRYLDTIAVELGTCTVHHAGAHTLAGVESSDDDLHT